MKPAVPTPSPAASSQAAGRRLLAWRIALGCCLVVIALLAWLPGHAVPSPNWSDKLNHLLAFTALGMLSWRAFPGRRRAAFLALVGFGVLIELVQWQLPTRNAEWADLAADGLGLVLGAALGALAGPRTALGA